MRKGRGREESEGSYGAFDSTVCELHTMASVMGACKGISLGADPHNLNLKNDSSSLRECKLPKARITIAVYSAQAKDGNTER